MGGHRGEGGGDQSGEGGIVEGDQGQVPGDGKASLGDGPDGAQGGLLTGGQEGGGPWGARGQIGAHGGGGGVGIHRGLHQIGGVQQAVGGHVGHEPLPADLRRRLPSVIGPEGRADEAHPPVAQTQQIVHRQADAQVVVKNHRVEPGLIRGGVEEDQVGAHRRQGLGLPEGEAADGHHPVHRPLRRGKALPSSGQILKGDALVQAGLLHIAPEIEVEGVLQLLGRGQPLRRRRPHEGLGRPAPPGFGGGVVEPSRLLQHLLPSLRAHRQTGVSGEDAGDGGRSVPRPLRELLQGGHGPPSFPTLGDNFTKNILAPTVPVCKEKAPAHRQKICAPVLFTGWEQPLFHGDGVVALGCGVLAGLHGDLLGLRGVLGGGLVVGAHGIPVELAVPGQAGAGGDELTDDDVLLQAQQVVHLALDGGLGEDLGGLLEGGGGQEGLGGQGGLGDTHDEAGGHGELQLQTVVGLAGVDAGLDGALGVLELDEVDGGAAEEVGVAGVLHADLPHHLAGDDLDVLVVDINALLTVGLLDFLDEVVVHGVDAADAQHVGGVQGAVGEHIALLDGVALLHPNAGVVGQGVGDHLAVAGGDGDVDHAALLGVLHADLAADLGQLGHLLGTAGLEELLNTGKTLGDIAAGHAAGVEGTHGQLGTGLADGLGGDDTHGLALAHGLADGQVDAVALGAHAAAGLTGEHGADHDLMDTVGLQQLGVVGGHHGVPADEDLAGLGIADVLHGVAALQALAEGLDDLAVLHDLAGQDAVVGTAVVLPDDDLLGHVHQTAGQVTGVGGTQSGIGHTLTGASGGDEVLQDGQALTEVGLDGDLDGTAGGIGHQATHSGQLTDLGGGTTGAGVGHHPDRIVAVQHVHQGIGHVLGGLLPGLDHQTIPLVVGQEAALVLPVDLDDLLLGGGDEGGLLGRHGHVVDGDGQGAPGGELITPGLDGVQHGGGHGEAVLGDALVDDLAQLLLAGDEVDLGVEHGLGIGAVHEAQVLGDALVEDQAAHGGAHQLVALLAVHLHGAADQDGHVEVQLALVVGQASLPVVGVHPVDLTGQLPVGGVGADAGVGGDVVQGAGVLHPHLVVGLDGALGQGSLHGSHVLVSEVVVLVLLIGEVVGTQHHVLGGHGDRAAVLGTQQVVGGEHQDAGLGLGLGGQGHVDGHLIAVEVGVEGGTHQGVQLDGTALHQNGLEGLDAQTVQRRRTVEHHRVLLDDEVQGVPHLGTALVHHLLGGLDVVGQAVLHQLFHDEGTEELNGHLLGQAALVDLHLRADHDNGTAGVVHALAQQVLTEAPLLAFQHIGEGFEGTVVGAGDGTAAAAVVDEGVHGLLEHPLLIADDDVGGVELDEALEAVVPVDDPAVEVVQVRGGEAAAVQLHHGAQLGGDDGQHINDHPLGLVAGEAEGVHYLQALDDAGLLLAGGVLQLGAELLGELLQVDVLEQLLHGLGAHGGLKVVLVLLPHIPVFLLGEDLVLGQGGEAGVGDDIGGEVEHLFQDTGADVQQQAHPGGDALEIPDVGHGGGQLDVAHALTAHLGPGDLHAAAVADLALVADLLVLAAVALPVLGGPEDLLAEQAVPLGLQGAVVDGLRLEDLAVGPLQDLLRGGDANADGVKLSVAHISIVLPFLFHIVLVAVEGDLSLFKLQAVVVAVGGRQVVVVAALLEGEAGGGEVGLPAGVVAVEVVVVPDAVGLVVVLVVVLELDLVAVAVQDLDIQAQGLELLDQHLEGLGHAGLGHVVALDDGLVGADTAGDVVGLDGEDLLEGVGGAVGLQGPHLHLAEALAAELGLAAQRLLGDQGVGAGGTGVDLIVHQVVELEEVDVAHGDAVVEPLAGTAVVEPALAVLGQAGGLKGGGDLGLVGAVEDGGGHLPAQGLGGVAQVDLQHLTDVHTGRHAQGVQHDVQGGAVGQEGHVLLGQDAGHDALVAVAAGHLVAHGDLTLLGDIDADHLVDAGGELVAGLAGEDLHVHDDAALSVGHLQGGVTDLAGLLTKNGPQEPLLGGEVGLALGGDLAHQDVAGVDLGAHADDAPLVQVLQGVLAHVGDVAGDLLGTQLGVPGLGLVLLDVNGGEDVLLHHTLVEEDGVLVVVAFPGHEAHEDVLAQGDLAVGGGGAVHQDVALLHPLAHADDGPLVDAGAVVGAHELGQLVLHHTAVVVADGDILGGDLGDLTGALGQNDDLGIDAVLVLLTGGHDGGLGGQQGHGLTLHVGAHQGTVGVVVGQEGDHGGGDGHHHLGGDVDIVHLLPVHLDDLVAVTAGDTGIEEVAVLIHGLGGLGDGVLVLDVGGHILDLVGDPAGGLVHLPVGSLDEAVPVDAGVGGQVGDQADVGTFGGLDGAQATVVGVVDITDVEGGAVTGQTAGAQGGHTALVGQLGQGVGLVHELAQGGGAEELLDGGGDGPDVDEGLGGDDVQVLDGHALPDDPLHAAEADAELVLEQLAHAAQAAVAQVVDVVVGAHAVGQAVEVVDGGHDVLHEDVLGHQVVHPVLHGLLQALLIPGVLLQQLPEEGEVDLLGDAALGGIEGQEALGVHHAVGEDPHQGALQVDDGLVDTLGLDGLGPLPGQDLAGLGDDLAGHGVGDGQGQLLAVQAGPDGQLLVELVTAHGGQVVPAGIKEEGVEQALGGVHRGGLAGAQLAVDLQEGVLPGLAGVLLHGGQDAGILAEHVDDLGVGPGTHRADEAGDGQLPVLVDADIEDVGEVGLILQPGAAVGDDGGAVGDVARLVLILGEVDAGGADDLGDDDTLGAVDDKGAGLGHQGEVAHEDLLLLDLLGLLVAQAHPDLDGGGVRGVPGLALLHVVLGGLIHGVVDEAQLQVARVVRDGGHILEDFPQAGVQEPLVGMLLDVQQVGHLQNLLVAGIALAQGLAVVDVLDHAVEVVVDHSENHTPFSRIRRQKQRLSAVFSWLHRPLPVELAKNAGPAVLDTRGGVVALFVLSSCAYPPKLLYLTHRGRVSQNGGSHTRAFKYTMQFFPRQVLCLESSE